MNDDVELSSDDEDEEMEAFMILQLLLSQERSSYDTSSLTGAEYIREILDGRVIKCQNMFRMNQECFRQLCDFLVNGNYIDESVNRHVPVEESVAIFLYIVGHSHRHRVAADRFQHSTEIINRHFKAVLRALAAAAMVLISPPNFIDVPQRIALNPNYNPWFQGAIGAIDGTLVDAWAPSNRRNACRSPKGNIAQNVMAACNFDMMFTFIYSGWEGSVNDSRVILSALQNGLLQIPPNHKYYLVDCGYSNMPGFLAPYRGERYHLQDYENEHPVGQRELFNKRHAQLMNVIERTFGVFKNRFPIFKYMTNYKPTRQASMVNACCALHNFIRTHSRDDSFFADFEDEDFLPPQATQQDGPNAPPLDITQPQINRMARKRDRIASAMWDAHVQS